MTDLILASHLTNTQSHDIWKNSVIHISEQSEGTLGFIMNQSVANIDHLAISKIYGVGSLPKTRVWCGGPVMTDRCTVIHSTDYVHKDTRKMSEHAALTFNDKVVSDIQEGKGPKYYKIILGFCQWETGQLDAEIMRGSWLATSHSNLMWSSYKSKDKMWRRIIERDTKQDAKTFLDSLTVE